jgi:hypothetical protein
VIIRTSAVLSNFRRNQENLIKEMTFFVKKNGSFEPRIEFLARKSLHYSFSQFQFSKSPLLSTKQTILSPNYHFCKYSSRLNSNIRGGSQEGIIRAMQREDGLFYTPQCRDSLLDRITNAYFRRSNRDATQLEEDEEQHKTNWGKVFGLM